VHGSAPHPLLVALHGCTQTAADFAAGTRFDELAEPRGTYVLYPEQAEHHNAQRCWQWFMREHQSRTAGEPAAILELIDEVCATHPIDRSRVFVTGLSAGGAMAGILAEQAPDVFAAVGIMAGVPLHASHDALSAYAAMHGDVTERDIAPVIARHALPPAAYTHLRVTIWAGAKDRRVAPSNASVLVRQFLLLLGLGRAKRLREAREDADILRWFDGNGVDRVEQWRVPLLGHAWSGGSLRGSHTFPGGPNASEEMLRFFLDGGPAVPRTEPRGGGSKAR